MKALASLTRLACACLLAATLPAAAAEDDVQLTRVTEQFKQQRERAQLSALALYADQLRGMRDSMTKSGDAAGAAKVSEELAAVRKKLAAALPPHAQTPAASPAPARKPAP